MQMAEEDLFLWIHEKRTDELGHVAMDLKMR